jgi:AraC-like DNA-binding protein
VRANQRSVSAPGLLEYSDPDRLALKSAWRKKALLSNHLKLRTTDYDEAHAFVDRVWEEHKSTFRGSPYGLSWSQVDLGRSALSYVETEAPEYSVCDGSLIDVYRVGFHDSGRMDQRINGKPLVSTPDQGFLHAPGQHLVVESKPFRVLSLAFPGPQVRHALSRRFASLPPFDTLAEMPLGNPAVQTLSSLCRWAAAELSRPASILSLSSRSCASLERTILSLFIDCLVDRHPDTGRRAPDLGAAQVRLVEQWMEANLTEPIGVEDLAAVADVSVRSLQLAFRRLRGCTPMQALMRRRLDLARVLLEQGGFGVNVTAIAMQLGFFNLGRFSARYRQAFGETPSATLARSRSGSG